MKQLYTVRVAKNDSVTNVVYEHVLHVWWQHEGRVLALEFGTRGEDRYYVYYPVGQIDHVHIIEEDAG